MSTLDLQAELTRLHKLVQTLSERISKLEIEAVAKKYEGTPWGSFPKAPEWYQPYKFPESPYSLGDIICTNKTGE